MAKRTPVSLLLLAAVLVCAGSARSQLVPDFTPRNASSCCLGLQAQHLSAQDHYLADTLVDWNQLGRYHADDERLKALPAEAGRVVFMGDSITDGWHLEQSFPGKPYVNRGISGQTTPQMLVRMFPDVIDLRPAAIIILAGTNDISGNTGPETLTMVEENLQAMVELAQKHGIKVVLCPLLPVSDYTAHKQTEHRPPSDILKLNGWIKDYAARAGATVADYYSAVVDDHGMLREGFSDDGLHPNAKGYELMAPVASAALGKAMQ